LKRIWFSRLWGTKVILEERAYPESNRRAGKGMSAFGIVWSAACSVFFVYCGWLLTFRTSTVVRRAYSKYRCNFFLKPWYSIFMRCIGIFIWVWTALIDYVVLTQILH
jgi:hypothetical protein